MKVVVTSKEAACYLPFAKKKLAALEKLRETTDSFFLQKTFVVGSIAIKIVAMKISSLSSILIYEQSVPSDFLLSGYDNLFAFDVYTGNFNNLNVNPGARSGTDLVPIYNGRLQFDQEIYIDAKGKCKAGEIANSFGTYATRNHHYETVIFSNGKDIYGRSSENGWKIATLPEIIIPEKSGKWFKNPVVTTKENTGGGSIKNWNAAYGEEVYEINQKNSRVRRAWIWTPNLHAMYPGEGTRVGWFYGQRYAPQFDFFYPLKEVEVLFKGVSECLTHNAVMFRYGHYELVTKAIIDLGDGNTDDCLVDCIRLYAYFSYYPPTTFGGGTEYYQASLAQNMEDAIITCGDSGSNKMVTFMYPLEASRFTEELKIKSWVVDEYFDTESLAITMPESVILAVYDGKQANFYRNGTRLLTTDRYKDHALSKNGKFLVVMEGNDFIDTVTVFDVFGVRVRSDGTVKEDDFSDGDEYGRPGWQLITKKTIDEDTTIERHLHEGAFVYKRGKGAVENLDYFVPNKANIEVTIDDNYEELPSMAMLSFWNDGYRSTTMKKIIIENGNKASLVTEDDECFFNYGSLAVQLVDIDKPDNTTVNAEDTGKFLIASTQRFGAEGAGSNKVFYISAEFTRDDYRPTSPIRSPWKTISMPKTFVVMPTARGELIPPFGYSGTIKGGKCTKFDDNTNLFVVDYSCCDTSYNAETGIYYLNCELETTCGQVGHCAYALEPLKIRGEDNAEVGQLYGASGGAHSYSWNVPCMGVSWNVSDDGNKSSFKITSLDGCCGTIEISVTDCSGDTDSKELKMPDGQWVIIENTGHPIKNYLTHEFEAGTYRYTHYYVLDTRYRYYAKNELRDAVNGWCRPISRKSVLPDAEWVCSGPAICGERPTEHTSKIPGHWWLDSTYYCPYRLPVITNYTVYVGWRVYVKDPTHYKVAKWSCP